MDQAGVSRSMFEGKRIHFVVPRYHTNMVPWVTVLQDAGAHVTIDVVTKGPTEEYSRLVPTVLEQSQLSIRCERLHKSPGTNKPYAFPEIIPYLRHLKSLNADVIIIRDPSRYVSILTLLLSLLLQARVVLYNQAAVDRTVSRLRLFAILGMNAVFNVRWISPVSTSYDVKRTALLPGHHFVPFVSANSVIKRRAVNSPIRMLSIGKYEPRKNHILLLKTLPALREAGFALSLTLVGECSTQTHRDEFERITEFIQANHLTEQVTLLKNQSAQSMSKLYMDSDLFILPSSAEPASVSVIEALGYGIPVVCSDQNGTKCYINPDINGAIFKDSNLDSLIRSITSLLTKMSVNPRLLFEQCWNVSEGRIAPEQFLIALKGVLE